MNKNTPVILVITPDMPTKLFIRHHLENKYHIIEKNTFDDAIQVIEVTNVDVVFIDDKTQNALDLCFQMKKRKRLFTVPIIVITGSLRKSFKEKAIKSGASDCLYTPLKEDEFLSILKKCEEEKNKINKVSSISLKIKKQ